jgi:hypothetical protein
MKQDATKVTKARNVGAQALSRNKVALARARNKLDSAKGAVERCKKCVADAQDALQRQTKSLCAELDKRNLSTVQEQRKAEALGVRRYPIDDQLLLQVGYQVFCACVVLSQSLPSSPQLAVPPLARKAHQHQLKFHHTLANALPCRSCKRSMQMTAQQKHHVNQWSCPSLCSPRVPLSMSATCSLWPTFSTASMTSSM